MDKFQKSIDFFAKYGKHLSRLATIKLGSEAPLPNVYSYFFMLPLRHLTYVQLGVLGAAVLNALARNNSQIKYAHISALFSTEQASKFSLSGKLLFIRVWSVIMKWI